MRFKILQQGGLVYNPLIINPTLPSATSATTTNKDKNSSSSGFELDDMVKEMIKTNGVTSDANYFFESVATVLNNPFSDLETSTGQLSQLSALMSLANRVKNNKTFYDNAVSNLNETNTWSDVAMTTSGRIYVYSEKGIDTITPEEYYKSEKEYTPLTNAQLIELRSTNEQFAFNESVLNDLSSAIGVDSLVEYVKKLVNDLGTTKLEGYTVKKQNQIQQGLEALLQLAPDGYYQLSSSEQAANKTEALKYLYSSLTPNMKRYLDVKVAVEGGNPKSNDKLELLSMILMNNVDSELGVKYDKQTSEADASMPAAKGLTGAAQHTRLTQAVTGHDLSVEQFNIKPFQSNTQLVVKGNDLGRFWDFDEKTLPQSNLKTLFTTSELGTVVDSNSIVFGDQPISFMDTNGILWDGNNITRVVLPYKIDNTGRKVPDFTTIEKANKISEYLRDHTNYTPAYINQLVNDTFNGAAYYDAKTNSIKFNQEWTFISFSAYAGSDTVPLNSNSSFIKKLSRPEGKRIKDLYNNMFQWGVSLEGKEDKASPIGGQGKSEANDMYQANVFIPLINETVGYFVNNHSHVPKSDFMDIEPKSQYASDKMITNF